MDARDYTATDDARRLDVDAVHTLLRDTYWAGDRSRDVVAESLRESLAFALFWRGTQVGVARVLTDRSATSYLCDVVIDPGHRSRGVGRWFMELVLDHPAVRNTRIVLVTRDAQDFYRQLGFVTHPYECMVRPDPRVASIREGHGRWAPVYDHDGNPLQALEEPAVRAALGDVRGLAVLDLGCGTGRHALWLAGAGARVTAVDFSEAMLSEARRKPGAGAIRFVVQDLHDPLPFGDGAFDLVVSGLVLEHLRALDGFFAEARRVLGAGRRAVISAMHPAMFLRDARARFTDPASGDRVEPGSFPHQLGDFVTAAVRAGFRLAALVERAPDAALAAVVPRAEKYVGWPMLVVLDLRT